MKVTFKIDADRLTLNDLIALEEENTSPRFQRDFLARFAVDKDGNYLDENEARELIGNLTFGELINTMDR